VLTGGSPGRFLANKPHHAVPTKCLAIISCQYVLW
jgi:hypothetical protein